MANRRSVVNKHGYAITRAAPMSGRPHMTLRRRQRRVSSTSAPTSNIRAQSAFFNAGLLCAEACRRYSTGAGVLGAIIVTPLPEPLSWWREVAIERARSVGLRTAIASSSSPPGRPDGLYILTSVSSSFVFLRHCGRTYLRSSALLGAGQNRPRRRGAIFHSRPSSSTAFLLSDGAPSVRRSP
jgi:hypothetical protein